MEGSLAGRTYLVTGATSGIGLAAAALLARRGASVLGIGRSDERCRAAEQQVRPLASTADVSYYVADLGIQEEVRRAAREIRDRVPALDGLVNNAGTFTYARSLTPDGFETQWAVNHLAPFLLTHELLPLLRRSATARVVTVSSNSHYHTRLNWSDLQMRRGYNGLLAYKRTKLCNVLFTAELRRRLGGDSPIRAFAADPGLVNTEMGFKHSPALARWIWDGRRRKGMTPEESARGVTFLAVEASIRDAAQIYWKHGRPQAPNPNALDPDAARRLWELSCEMCGIPPEGYGLPKV